MTEKEIINQINEVELDLRETIGLNPNITFGTEIELENIEDYDISNLKEDIKYAYPNWQTIPDSTLNEGLEINSPILSDEKSAWLELADICEIAKEYGEIGENSGGHIHIGAQAFKNPHDIVKFLELWALHEKTIYRFSAGEQQTTRPNAYTDYAEPIGELIRANENKLWNAKTLLEIKQTLEKLKSHHAINLYHLNPFSLEYAPYNTIEIRCPNGTLNPIIWQNNINFFGKMIETVSKGNYDEEKTRYRLHKMNTTLYKVNSYSVHDAINLADTVFESDLDKAYFLKQTIK